MRAELRDTDIEVSCVMPGVVNTELASGLPSARGVKNVEPEDVAAEIVSALEHPRFDVFVPRVAGTITKVMGVLPRSAREAVGGSPEGRKVLAAADPEARRGYELRASQSEPGLEGGEPQKQLSDRRLERTHVRIQSRRRRRRHDGRRDRPGDRLDRASRSCSRT